MSLGKARASRGKAKASAAGVAAWIVIALVLLLTVVWTIWAAPQPAVRSIWGQD
jgi:hypothetical protein